MLISSKKKRKEEKGEGEGEAGEKGNAMGISISDMILSTSLVIGMYSL